jgi:hypothetical protein
MCAVSLMGLVAAQRLVRRRHCLTKFERGREQSHASRNWSELMLSPVHWFKFGMVTQRTRACQVGPRRRRPMPAKLVNASRS